MRLYLIRHGRTFENARRRHQTEDTALSPRGVEQAYRLAEHMKENVPVEVLITSDMPRAVQTGELVAARLGVPLHTTPLMREVRRPLEVVGKWYYDPRALWVMTTLLVRSQNLDYRYSNEENGRDLIDRAEAAIAYLVNRPEEHIAVVSHRTFMKILVGVMLAHHDSLFKSFLFALRYLCAHANTGITELESYEKGGEVKWKLVRWNDRRHVR